MLLTVLICAINPLEKVRPLSRPNDIVHTPNHTIVSKVTGHPRLVFENIRVKRDNSGAILINDGFVAQSGSNVIQP